MKKYTYLLAIALLALSCNKEAEQNSPEVIPETNQGTDVIYAKITEEPVKTAYDADGKFTWVNTDQVTIITHKDGDAENQKCFTYSTSDGQISNEGKYASFSGSIESGYVKTGFAAYPTSLASDITISSYNAPFVWVRSSAKGTLDDIFLIGIGDGDEYKFNTASSVFKITITGLPATAKEVRLVSNDYLHYPMDGEFVLAEVDGVATLDFAHYQISYPGSYKGYQSVDVSALGALDSKDFYFNVPVGTYPADVLSIQILDAEDNIIFEKNIHKSITTVRNELLSLPVLNVDEYWTTLGTGKFIDNFLWAKITTDGYNPTVGRDVPTYVDVTIQQNANNPNQFRLVNPYGEAAAAFNYTRNNSANADKYLVFTVSGTTEGSSVSSFETHRTGFAIDSGYYNPELVYPTVFNSSYTDFAALNKVLAGNESLPKIIQLAPVYRYSGTSTAYNQSHGLNKNGVFRIIFPNVSGYEGNVGLDAGATAATISPLNWSHGANAGRIIKIISPYTDVEIAAPWMETGKINSNTYYIGNYPAVKGKANATSGSGWDMASTIANANYSSGPLYLSWFTVKSSAEENVVYSQGCAKVYYLSQSDIDLLCKQHTSTGYVGNSGSTTLNGTYTFAPSDNPLNSNIMMTEFDGMQYSGGSLPASGHRIYNCLTWINEEKYTGANPTYVSGYAQHGVYNPSSSSTFSLDASKYLFKKGDAEIYLFTYNEWSNSAKDPTPKQFTFTVVDGKVNIGQTQIVARFLSTSGKASGAYAFDVTEVTE